MHDIEYVDETTLISKCASIMLAKRVSSLAVGSGDHVDGIFTKTDLVKYYDLHLPIGHRKVNDYKTFLNGSKFSGIEKENESFKDKPLAFFSFHTLELNSVISFVMLL